MSKFEELLKLDVNDKKEKRGEGRNALDYLSWVYSWAEFKKAYPDGDYEIVKFIKGVNVVSSLDDRTTPPVVKGGHLVPYMYDETGYMVCTKVRDGLGSELEMWLPVMDSNNNAMKSEPYEYQVKEYKDKKWTGNYITKTVDKATMFDVNKALMRCLVKNIAMYGIGLYIYAGEDLPDKITSSEEDKAEKRQSLSKQVAGCRTEAELKSFYESHKSEIISNKNLLDLVTEKGKELRGSAA